MHAMDRIAQPLEGVNHAVYSQRRRSSEAFGTPAQEEDYISQKIADDVDQRSGSSQLSQNFAEPVA